ncbi:hypothetical protein V4762_06590 [Thermodesulfobium sp. 4217-1]|uniref:hypothetical protein n=1 Tax=Thermodesulfobium sp. 4217-1 TaxID=3120013 RepID=UPI00322148AB
MKLLLDIKNEKLLNKILGILKSFGNDDLEIIKESEPEKKTYSDEYIEMHWKEISYKASGNIFLDDDFLPDAYLEYLDAKSSF